MRHTLGVLALLLLTSSSRPARAGEARGGGGAQQPLERALKAVGGQKALEALRSWGAKGSVRHWEPEQSMTPGGEARMVSDSTFTLTRDLAGGRARIEWVRKFAYPSPREYTFTEVVTPAAGAVLGVDTTARTKQSQESNPPQHAMSGLRLAAAQRELLRTSPTLLLEMKKNPKGLSRAPEVELDGQRLPAVQYQWRDSRLLVMFDRESGLPVRVRTMDHDNIHGDSAYDLVLSDWREVGGVQFAHEQLYQLNGKDIARIRYEEVQANPEVPADAFQVPGALRAAAARPATKGVPYQWVLRRQHIGVYLDSDQVMYDPKASQGLKLTQVAPGVHQVVGGSHNSLLVEMADHLVALDAPIDTVQSRWTLDAARKQFPGKAVKYLVLTHHHMDHAGGARAYVAQGATLVVGAPNRAHFEQALRAPSTLGGGGPQRRRAAALDIVEVADKEVLTDGQRTLELYRIDNPHAEGMLVGYLPEARLGFVTDLWSPGRDKLGDKATPGQAALVAAMRKRELTPERFAAGHGSTGEYAPLAALADAASAGAAAASDAGMGAPADAGR